MNDQLTRNKTIANENEMRDVINHEIRTSILCSVEAVTRSEYYAAAKHDMQPEIVFVNNKCDYKNQSLVEYEGQKDNVMRMYEPKGRHNPTPMYIDRLELVCKGVD